MLYCTYIKQGDTKIMNIHSFKVPILLDDEVVDITKILTRIMRQTGINRIDRTYSIFRLAVREWHDQKTDNPEIIYADQEWQFAENAMRESGLFKKSGRSKCYIDGKKKSFIIWALKGTEQDTPVSITEAGTQLTSQID